MADNVARNLRKKMINAKGRTWTEAMTNVQLVSAFDEI